MPVRNKLKLSINGTVVIEHDFDLFSAAILASFYIVDKEGNVSEALKGVVNL